MKKYINIVIIFVMPLIQLSCAEDDYIIGGELNLTNKFEMSTFEFLSQMEETSVIAELFDLAGLKDEINGDVTVVAPNIWSLNRYLRRKNNQALRVDPNAEPITID